MTWIEATKKGEKKKRGGASIDKDHIKENLMVPIGN